MKFVVTGGRGFIGSHFIELVLSKGHSVVDIDKMTYCSNEKLPFDKDAKYKLIKKDIAELKHLPLCDVIVNFAAESHVDNSISSPGVFIESNIKGTYNLLELTRGKLYQRPLFVHISTDEVYGDVRAAGATESSLLIPSNPYSASKAAAEMLVQAYGRTYGLKYIITRSSNNYGPRQFEEKLIPRIIASLKTNSKVPIHGDGSYVRDWLYVEDNVNAIYSLIEGRHLGIWNIAAQNHLTNIQVLNEVCSWFNIKPEKGVDYELVENRLGQDERYSMSTDKIERLTSWRPEHRKGLYNFLEE